ncbi:MAG: DUF933 domain-containing protein, partial [Candidatus Omnitrophota bacterium]
FGKKALLDPRLKVIEELYRSQKATQIQLEFTTEKDLKTADAIVCLDEKKLDLVILDMEIVEGKLGRELSAQEAGLLKRAQELLEKEVPLSLGSFTEDEKKWLSNNNLVTIKPVIFISIAAVDDLSALAKRAYDEGGRISFLTGGIKEARAWEVRKGATAVEAAHAIHSDLARGFIRAEVMAYNELVKVGNVNQAKSGGCLRQEGKDYIVQDGDVIEFKSGV